MTFSLLRLSITSEAPSPIYYLQHHFSMPAHAVNFNRITFHAPLTPEALAGRVARRSSLLRYMPNLFHYIFLGRPEL